MLIVFGLPGTGKSYFSKLLATELGYEYISSDETRKKNFANRNYSDTEKTDVYHYMLREISALIQQDRDVIIDGTFYKETIREAFKNLAIENKQQIKFIEITAKENLIKERVELKRQDSDADFSVYIKIKKEFEPLLEEHLILTSEKSNIKEMLAKTNEYLKKI